jgi:hypothetical protein
MRIIACCESLEEEISHPENGVGIHRGHAWMSLQRARGDTEWIARIDYCPWCGKKIVIKED